MSWPLQSRGQSTFCWQTLCLWTRLGTSSTTGQTHVSCLIPKPFHSCSKFNLVWSNSCMTSSKSNHTNRETSPWPNSFHTTHIKSAFLLSTKKCNVVTFSAQRNMFVDSSLSSSWKQWNGNSLAWMPFDGQILRWEKCKHSKIIQHDLKIKFLVRVRR